MTQDSKRHDGHDHQHPHADAHEHEHHPVDTSHAHDHGPHAGAHFHPEALPQREPLQPRSGVGKILFFDAFSGIAGDMTVAALVDLGVPFAVVREATAALGLDGYSIDLEHRYAGAIGVTRFCVRIEQQNRERSYAEIDHLLGVATLDEATRHLARRIFARLAAAESRVHRIPLERVHFHEVGAIDAIVDIVGAAACLSYLGARVMASPLPMGRGLVQSRHGPLPLPAPATLECLEGVPTLDAGIDAELTTPTGAAIIATIAESYQRWPDIRPERIGWGGGVKELADRPNALRLVLGQPLGSVQHGEPTHVILEANVDDMTGELAGHAIEALIGAGALDAWALAITMKKGRPGLLISALAASASADRVAEVLLRETSSIGVRRIFANRTERPRRIVHVATRFGTIPVKVSEGPFGPPQVKPEFDVCASAARKAGVPVREVIAEAQRAFHSDGGVPPR